jgi:potassium-dependent mechanosensitive channel
MNPRFVHGSLVLAMAVFFCLWPTRVIAAEQGTSGVQSAPHPPSTATFPTPPSAAIPISEIATKAAEATNALEVLSMHSAPSLAIEGIETQLPDVRRHIDVELAETAASLLRGDPPLDRIQALQKQLQGKRLQTAGWLKTLTERAVQLKGAMDRLEAMRTQWTATREAAQASNAPALIFQETDALTAAIDAALTPIKAKQADVLDLQAAVSHEVSRCESALSQLALAQQKAVGGMLTRVSQPFWSSDLWANTGTSLPAEVHRVAVTWWNDVRQYVLTPSMGMPFQAGLYLVLVLLLCAARRQAHLWAEPDEGLSAATTALARPYSAAFLAFLIVADRPASSIPATVQQLLSIPAIVPAIRLVAPVASPTVTRCLYVIGIFYISSLVRQAFAGTPWLEQAILVLETLAGAALLGWALASGHIRRISEHVERASLQRAIPLVSGLMLLGLAIAFAATVFGYLRLARVLETMLLGMGMLALGLYSWMRIAIAMAAFTLRVWPVRLLLMVQHHRDLLVHRIDRVLLWAAVAVGVIRSLDRLGLLQPVVALGDAMLSQKLERGSISISLGDVLAFVLTVWVSYLLSAFIRFVLQEDIYPRLEVPMGLSYATSSLLNYVVLALGVVVGLGVLGMDLTKVTVMAGALGVGIGFGLQSVVNNFVSGLILLFERPIHVGDSIEVGSLIGEVRRIGIRASTIHTRQGADIIVPNAQLVTDKVTNWTLSDQHRRIDLPVGVNYGADPKQVIEVLEGVARAHPRILKHPAPYGLFQAFGDNSINFELRAWTAAFADWSRIRSDLASGVYDAVQAAGWSFPFPQQEVRLLNPPKPEEPSTEIPLPSSAKLK